MLKQNLFLFLILYCSSLTTGALSFVSLMPRHPDLLIYVMLLVSVVSLAVTLFQIIVLIFVVKPELDRDKYKLAEIVIPLLLNLFILYVLWSVLFVFIIGYYVS